jgi:hypothetical protein
MSAAPCETRGVGTSPLACKRVVEKSRVENAYRSLLAQPCTHNLQRGITLRRQSQSQSRSAYEKIGEMVMVMVRIEEHVQSMCRQSAAVW